ncbi:hypothetical protein ACSFXN_19610 [Planococcus sp. 1R117A]|uniref:hypothetical protein n=1 Tax=Planococcus sp. 1R117A TaxID=3447020 RepID=UPI003EDBB989
MFYRGKEAKFRLKVSGLKDYLKYLEEIEEVIDEKRITVKQSGEMIPEENQDEYWDHYLDEYDKYDSVFPNILRKSIFTSLFAYFEHQLMAFCEDKEKLKNIPGVGIDKAKGYISNHLEIRELFQEKEWEVIKKYSKVRNCLAHAGGVIYLMKSENEQGEIRKFINATKGIEINEGDEIILTSLFCEEFVSIAFEFLTKTFHKIEKAP